MSKELDNNTKLDDIFDDLHYAVEVHQYLPLESSTKAKQEIQKHFISREEHEELLEKARAQFHAHYSGKPIKHPVPCEDCGSDYWMDWLLPHPVFNAVCPDAGYLCLPCFANRLDQLNQDKEGEKSE